MPTLKINSFFGTGDELFINAYFHFGAGNSYNPLISSSATEIRFGGGAAIDTTLTGTGFTFNANGDATGGTITSVSFGTRADLTGISWLLTDFEDAVAANNFYWDNRTQSGSVGSLDDRGIIELYSLGDLAIDGSDLPRIGGGGALRDYGFFMTTPEKWASPSTEVTLLGSSYNDVLYGRSDFAPGPKVQAITTLVSGRGGDDRINGGNLNEDLRGGSGDDVVTGGAGRDKLQGGNNNDRLFGDQGNDKLFGGSGIDILNGGSGKDYLVGGTGADIFEFNDASGRDQIRDFAANNNKEKIDLSDVTAIKGFFDLKTNHMVQSGSNVVIDDGASMSVVVIGVDISDMNRGDFLF